MASRQESAGFRSVLAGEPWRTNGELSTPKPRPLPTSETPVERDRPRPYRLRIPLRDQSNHRPHDHRRHRRRHLDHSRRGPVRPCRRRCRCGPHRGGRSEPPGQPATAETRAEAVARSEGTLHPANRGLREWLETVRMSRRDQPAAVWDTRMASPRILDIIDRSAGTIAKGLKQARRPARRQATEVLLSRWPRGAG